MQKIRPIVGIPMDSRNIKGHSSYVIMEKYVKPIVEIVDAIPILLPPLATEDLLDGWVSLVDGLLLTGSASDIHPKRYDDSIKNPDSFFDEMRDETNLNLINIAGKIGLPILGICRGFQEINVALGGTLHQSIHRTEKFIDHREIKSDDLNISYGERHNVTAVPDGRLIKMVNKSQWQVNSLHDQGIDKLADTLQAEAHADDGLVEAFSLIDNSRFMLATQWHIEWNAHNDQCSLGIFKAFANACIEYAILKQVQNTEKSNRKRS